MGLMMRAAAAEEGVVRQPGTNFAVNYEEPVGDDFTLGGGAGVATVPQYNPRVLRVAPGGPSAAAGVRVGDEVVFVRKEGERFIQESVLRQKGDVDAFVKNVASEGGSVLTFRACGVKQVGDTAPDFRLPDANGTEVSLADLREGGKSVVLFFRPGRRFFNGDLDELKIFSRAEAALRDLGASVAGVTTDRPPYLKRQAQAYGIRYPLLSDANCAVAQSYGAFLDLDGVGPTADRKTFVLGADGRVAAVFPAVGWEAGKSELAAHVGNVARVLGGDAEAVELAALPRQPSLGDIVALSQKR